MKYDLNKIVDETTVKLQWHGESTKVLIDGQGEKTDVNTGDVLEVSVKQAKELLKYSYLWTLEGDKPLAHPYDKVAVPNSIKTTAKETSEEDLESEEVDLDTINFEDKKQVIAGLKMLKATFNDRLGVKKLAELLKELIEEKKQSEPESIEIKEGDITDQGIAHYVTEEDLENNEELDENVKVGDLIYLSLNN